MLRACPYCQRVHDKKYDCGKRPQELKRNTVSNRFRNSAAWTKKRKEIRERDNNLCQACIRDLEGTKVKYNSKMLSVHHAIAIHKDYSRRLDNDNLLTLCAYHHDQAEKGKIKYQIIKNIIDEQNEKARDCGA
jgi:HNH endonuclease|nr:MAG TPA: NinG recombination protein [Caudoviricetes sp.]